MRLGLMMAAVAPMTFRLLASTVQTDCLFKGPENRIPYGIAKFGTDDWDAKLGNHRAVVDVKQDKDVALAYLPWRRRDAHPETKNILVIDALSGKTVSNRVVVTCNKEYSEVAFQPVGGKGRYYLYYMQPVNDDNAFKWPRWAFPVTRYVAPNDTASVEWMSKNRLLPDSLRTLPMRPSPAGDSVISGAWRELPAAELVEIQSRRDPSGSDWNSFYPMEVIATLDERLGIEHRCRLRPFILFPENRRNPIRMTDTLPYCWAVRDAKALDTFSDTLMRNEYYVFQIGVYASKNMLAHLKATWTELKATDGAVIPADALTCFNLSGNDQFGNPFTKVVHVERNHVQAMWFGVDIPKTAHPGVYEGTVTVNADDVEPQTIKVSFTVDDHVLVDRGDGDHWRLSRLRWLNSRLGVDDDVCVPFTPMLVDGRIVSLLGRSVEMGADGLPEQIQSRIEMFSVRNSGRSILAAPIRFEVIRGGAPIVLTSKDVQCVHKAPGLVRFASDAESRGLTQLVETTVEMDGFISEKITLKADAEFPLDTVRLTIPISSSVATFIMGNGATKALTSRCPEKFECGAESFDRTWLGDYNAGVALCLPGDRSSWGNCGAGRVKLRRKNDFYEMVIETGPMVLPAGVARSFVLALCVTPFKPMSDRHWDWRYYHAAYGSEPDVKRGLAAHAKIFTVHHGCKLNPYISCPFLVAPELRKMADEIHQNGGLFKAYYTIREISNRLPELWALRSLGNEILEPSPAHIGYEEMSQLPLEYQLRNPYNHPLTGQSWMCEHLVNDYHTRWHSVIGGSQGFQDGSLQINGASRWSNFYIEGLRWLIVNAGMDGLYLDGITFDRESFKRVRKVLVRQKPESLIDYHGEPNQTILQLPYFDSLWFGEGADYTRDPDYWLVAVSGIPFGVPGELLKHDASVQRGMVFGLCQRYGWMGGVDPSGLWGWWDEFGIKSAEMIGYWMPHCPVKISDTSVRATAYVHKDGKTAIALASWAKCPVKCRVEIDFKALGLNPAKVVLHAPAIQGFQTEATFKVGDALPIAPGGGMILVLNEEENK